MSAYWVQDEHAEDYDNWVNELLERAPESFDDDVAAEEIVLRYVRWLEAHVRWHAFVGVSGHPDDDECTYRWDGTDSTYCGESEYAPIHTPQNVPVAPSQPEPSAADAMAEGHSLPTAHSVAEQADG